ncbi:unnamed protein product [Bursaphelenchus xylophilus]|uniref:(pine wood nematode) hypothetical protein n=1 Tax=Bursaphelenchus xylophilus TaxID=6326 RepID=A0A1I7RV38_BURXY|nr:unnamed protein product [Bursaphelenchus xylophilus]CAG9105142.1 unnamed protein product [Bursaphelenchus xylophilus]
MAEYLSPTIAWAQRDKVLYLTVKLEDMNVEELKVDGNQFLIRGTSAGKKYQAELEFHGEIDKNQVRQVGTKRHIELILGKKENKWWPRLTSKPVKLPWLKVDFDKWVDEDEQGEEEDPFDFSDLKENIMAEELAIDELEDYDSDESNYDDMPPLQLIENSENTEKKSDS